MMKDNERDDDNNVVHGPATMLRNVATDDHVGNFDDEDTDNDHADDKGKAKTQCQLRP